MTVIEELALTTYIDDYAATHRDYGIKGTDIQIKMFDDRLEVDSPGTFAGIVKKDNIRYTHFSRNPKIAAFLKDYGYVKEYGEGVDRMCRELEADGLPDPIFNNSTFILETTVMSSAYAKLPIQVSKVSDSEQNPAVHAQEIGDSKQKSAVTKIEFSAIAALCKKNGYNKATLSNVRYLYDSIELNQVFSATYVRKVLSCADSTARRLIGQLKEINVVVPVTGKGKGVYRFKYESEM